MPRLATGSRALFISEIIVIFVTGCGGGGAASPAAQSVALSPAAAPPTTVPASATASAVASAAPTQAVSVPPTATVSAPASASATGSLPPASFELSVAGDDNVKGTWGASFGITCDNPSFDGSDVLFFAKSPDKAAVVLVTLAASSIDVNERAGAGADYTSRDFTGTGVSAFDAAKGATFNSDLTEVQQAGAKPGKLGAITHISGSVDCGNQTPGTSTVQVSGATADGAVSGPFESSRIACVHSAQNGDAVNVTALVTAGTTPTLLIVHFPADGKATIFQVTNEGQTSNSYAIDPTGDQAMTATGGHVDADFEEVVTSGTPHVLHLAGDLTCGTSTST